MMIGGCSGAVVRRVEDLFPGPLFSLYCASGYTGECGLYPEERPLVQGAVVKRVREFATGRLCARRALTKLSVAPTAIPCDSAGAPIWPPGITGSISHCDRRVVAVVTRTEWIPGLGVDIEYLGRRFPTEVIPALCTSAEKARLQRLPRAALDLQAYILFSVKESVFKCLYTTLRWQLGWQNIDVHLQLQQGTFTASVTRRDHAPFPYPVTGRLGHDGLYVFSGAWLQYEKAINTRRDTVGI